MTQHEEEDALLLSQLCDVLVNARPVAFEDIQIESLATDSRMVEPGSLFIALRGGGLADRHEFIPVAVENGAVALLVEEEQAGVAVPQIVVKDVRLAAGIVADRFYGHPSHHMRVIGVTGTNGKTTTTHMIEWVLSHAGFSVGLRGTVGRRINGQTQEVGTTTPEAVELQAAIAEMREAHCEYCVMEVSSHALDLKRDAGTKYGIAVFTNLTQDHLDYHGTMENYLAAKGRLFSRLGNAYAQDLKEMAYGVVNRDDAACDYLIHQTTAPCITYGLGEKADVRATDVSIAPAGATFRVTTFAGDARVQMRMTGRFNVYNALAAIAVGLIERVPLDSLVKALESMPGVPGRLEPVHAGQSFGVLVDYSHTPDSLENALKTVKEFTKGRVLCVVGCGGDRDKTKRPLMARIAATYSELTILTSDNPRTEFPEAILDDMEAGLKQGEATSERSITGTSERKSNPKLKDHVRIVDRRKAIEYAVREAQAEDVILIAGKGHETYQIIGREKHHFDDREVAREAITVISPGQ